MNWINLGRTAAVLFAAMSGATAMAADPYPTRPIRIIVAVPPGGAADINTRLVAQKMSEKLGQQIIVENKPGGDTVLATRFVKGEPADGYTILQQSNTFSTQPLLKQDPGFVPLKDFQPLGPIIRGPVVLEVGGEQPDKTFADLVNRAKSTHLMLGSPGMGSSPHLAAELALLKAGVKMQHIPYKGASTAYSDVITGRIHLFPDGYAGSAPHLKSGKMRALAITGPARIAPLPDVPTLKELGYDVTFSYWIGLVVKTGTSKEIVQKLSEALKYATSSKDFVDRSAADGVDPSFMTPEQFTDYIAKEIDDVTKLIKQLDLPKE
jgi:tripartite-type tricarboxylate transporter receptor subunit TctC